MTAREFAEQYFGHAVMCYLMDKANWLKFAEAYHAHESAQRREAGPDEPQHGDALAAKAAYERAERKNQGYKICRRCGSEWLADTNACPVCTLAQPPTSSLMTEAPSRQDERSAMTAEEWYNEGYSPVHPSSAFKFAEAYAEYRASWREAGPEGS